MQSSNAAHTRAEGHFLPKIDQHEKGSAMGLIRADAEARREKTAKLKALRLAHEATEPQEAAAKPPARKRVKRGRT
ncbi:hypothetical protein [Antarcticirhabdus aurantiaca]|uniref:Uncharacterized protein n=1 Tax=Antarcticirhabdus aurantiaca TaxID=2606717 RepID=A0ACD4NTR5_9HYPH|nr:hypothetical protein [Antarcticirhabdus aurantiaca]WAJ30159.1 hypothetical protein OXU80_08110 [Jeongeuplla avenae]